MAADNDVFKADIEVAVRTASFIPFFNSVATTAETIIADAFDSQGFGDWPDWKDPSYQNNTGMVLVDTQQLRNSITSEVKE